MKLPTYVVIECGSPEGYMHLRVPVTARVENGVVFTADMAAAVLKDGPHWDNEIRHNNALAKGGDSVDERQVILDRQPLVLAGNPTWLFSPTKGRNRSLYLRTCARQFEHAAHAFRLPGMTAAPTLTFDPPRPTPGTDAYEVWAPLHATVTLDRGCPVGTITLRIPVVNTNLMLALLLLTLAKYEAERVHQGHRAGTPIAHNEPRLMAEAFGWDEYDGLYRAAREAAQRDPNFEAELFNFGG
jgi:hypothetical protein